jgi:hypothetical protein
MTPWFVQSNFFMNHFDIDGDGLINFHEYLLIVTLLSIPLKVHGIGSQDQQLCSHSSEQSPLWPALHDTLEGNVSRLGLTPAGCRDSLCNVGRGRQ